jgi:hypothetical protein
MADRKKTRRFVGRQDDLRHLGPKAKVPPKKPVPKPKSPVSDR